MIGIPILVSYYYVGGNKESIEALIVTSSERGAQVIRAFDK